MFFLYVLRVLTRMMFLMTIATLALVLGVQHFGAPIIKANLNTIYIVFGVLVLLCFIPRSNRHRAAREKLLQKITDMHGAEAAAAHDAVHQESLTARYSSFSMLPRIGLSIMQLVFIGYSLRFLIGVMLK
ncbi:MAG: hypothetical protein JWP09_524 [Candidatus Taylorbacteria bacterium]|nr:hypothetical protein [Candidatus Taylorbacteria bacterium]